VLKTSSEDAIEDALLHFGERQQRCLAYEFLDARYTQHFSAGVKDVGDAVGIEHHAVAGIEVHVQRPFGIHRVGQDAEDHAARFEQARLPACPRDHGRRMALPEKRGATDRTNLRSQAPFLDLTRPPLLAESRLIIRNPCDRLSWSSTRERFVLRISSFNLTPMRRGTNVSTIPLVVTPVLQTECSF